ncbi:MAG TPA: DUF4143 domain-containing protein, partial [Acidimicrobiales bacterium]
GQLVLAGSTRFLTEPRLSESLAGRVRFLDLWPLSQGEIHGGDDGLLDALLTGVDAVRARRPPALGRSAVAARIATGGLPEAVLLDDDPASIARAAGMADTTVRRYLPLLEAVFAFHELTPFSANLSARASGRTKAHLVDTGLATQLVRETGSRLADPASAAFGPLFETFVVNEVARQRTWSDQIVDLHHVRVHRGAEVDLVAIGDGGRVAGVEVKATASPGPSDARGLRWLAGRMGDRWVQGVVVCMIDRPVPLGAGITAVPVAAVWSAG